MSEFVNHLEAAALKLDSTLNRINKTLVDKANEEENAKISTSIPQGNK
jgi:hypothetical protein